MVPTLPLAVSLNRRRFIRSLKAGALLFAYLFLANHLFAGVVPVAGDIIFNEYAADNDANGNDFFELLVLTDNLDLRGLRVTDNELTAGGTLNNGESVFVFGTDSYLNNVPKGTLIAVYTLVTGVTTDVVVNPAASDWKMVLAPGTGFTISVDGLGGSINAGLSTSGEALYLYLPGPDGNSAGTDNIYLDFISSEGGGGALAPTGLTYIDLPSLSDNAYYTGNTAAGNDVAANWVRYDGAPNASTTPGDPNPTQDLSALRVVPPPMMRITEYMYDGANMEFIEFTNVGSTAINMTGWSYDDDSRVAGTVSLSAFGTVAAGESVILAEATESNFRAAWNLCPTVKVIGSLSTNLGRSDEINLFDATNTLVDRLTYGDQTFPGTIRTQNKSGWVSAAGLGANQISQWTLSAVSDGEGSFASSGNDIGSPGKSTRATVSFDPCPAPPNGAPTVTENTASTRVNLNATTSGSVSGVIDDPTDPASTLGIDFTIADDLTPVGSIVVTVASSNQAVVPNANLNLTGSGATRNLKITPAGVGYATITVSATDLDNATGTYIINYAASAASVHSSTTRFYTGTSDASTAIAVDASYMLVGDDENQVLRLYDRANSGLPVNGFDFSSSLNLTDLANPEVDIEASTQIGNRIYWLGSHSNSANAGNPRPNRYRLFATDISGSGAGATLSYVGRYDGLRTDLLAWDANNGHGLGANYFGLTASAATGVIPEAPDGAGFNIEGLTIAPDGATGYLGFRAPIEPTSNRTKALIVPVTNFTSLVSGNPTAGPATFGTPIQLDLGGRGIRELKRNASGQYLIVAGPHDGDTGMAPKDFRLYTWTGNPADAPVLHTADLTALQTSGSVESIVEMPDPLTNTSQLQVLIDNGDAVYYNDGTIAKDLGQNNFKKFRSELVTLGDVDCPPVTVDCPSNAPACLNTPAYALSGASPAGGVYSGDGVSANMFDPATAGSGPHTITYTYTGGNTCTYDCMYTITVQACTVDFSGKILFSNNMALGVKDALVSLTGSATGSNLSDVNGNFQIPTAVGSGSFTLKPAKTTNKLNGVTVADATAIQQHVAHINLITDPYKLVAADVNKSNSINTLDASIIQQLILGNPAANAQFSTSWRFVPTNYTLTNPPWGFPEQRTYSNINSAQTGQDFYGIKTGDVVTTYADPANFSPEASGLVLRVQDQILESGKTIDVEFDADQFNDLASFQFALHFDPAQLQLLTIAPVSSGFPLTLDNFGTYNLTEGEIRAAWSQAKGLDVPGATPVFHLRFMALQSGTLLSAVLQLNDPEVSGLPGLSYNSAFAESGVDLLYSTSTATGQAPGLSAQLLQNRPNPFRGATTIGFVLPAACDAQLRVYDMGGRLLREYSASYTAGEHTVAFDFSAEDLRGVLHYELTTPWGVLARKMVLVGN